LSGPVAAQSIEEKMQTLQAQMDALRQELAALKKEQAAKAQPDLKVEAKGAPRFSGDGFKNFKLRGRLMADLGHVSDAGALGDPGLGTASEIRRARLGVEGGLQMFKYKFELDFADNEVEVADALIEWDAGPAVITLGNQKTPNSMEELTSSRFTAFIERAGFTDAFDFARQLGVSVALGGDHYGFSVGAFADGALSGDDEANGYVLAARGHYVADVGDGWVHGGASILHRASGAAPTRYRNRPLVHTTDTRFISASTNAPRDTVFGIELGGATGAVWAAAEWSWARADLAAPLGPGLDGTFSSSGGYAHVGWFVTGEQRGFKKSEGAWDRTKPRRPLSDGGPGAFAVNLGFDYTDLSDSSAGIMGGQQTGYLASLTWIPEAHVRFMAQYGLIDIDDSFPDGDGNGHVNTLGLRAQVDW